LDVFVISTSEVETSLSIDLSASISHLAHGLDRLRLIDCREYNVAITAAMIQARKGESGLAW
jgi:hypothetical protein